MTKQTYKRVFHERTKNNILSYIIAAVFSFFFWTDYPVYKYKTQQIFVLFTKNTLAWYEYGIFWNYLWQNEVIYRQRVFNSYLRIEMNTRKAFLKLFP